MEKEKRKRGFTVQRNYDYDHNATGISEDDWREEITSKFLNIYETEKVDFLAFAFHDKDIKDGKPAALHAHMVIKFTNPRYPSAVRDLVGATSSQNCQPTASFAGSAQYLLHATTTAVDETKKHIYDQDIIIARGIDPRELMLKNSSKANDNEVKELVEKLMTAIMDGDMLLEHAIDEIEDAHGATKAVQHLSRLEKAEQLFARRKTIELDDMNLAGEWERITTFVSGPGQSGKSRMALAMASADADKYKVHTVVGGGGAEITTDIVDGYRNQKTAVLDDVHSSTFKSRAFFQMFDRNNWAITSSRNYNKPWFVEKVYMTTDIELSQFFLELIFYSSTQYQYAPYGKGKHISSGDERLNGRTATLEQIRMAARRVQQYIRFDYLDDGTPIVRLFQIVKDYPTAEDLRAYGRKHLDGVYDKRIFDLFYEEIAYIPYDDSFEDSKQFENERLRIADIAISAYRGNADVDGLDISYEPTELSKLRLDIERNENNKIREQERKLKQVQDLDEDIKEIERLKNLDAEDLAIQKKKNELAEERYEILKRLMDKFDDDDDAIRNPFEPDAILNQLEKIIDGNTL